MPSFDSFPIRTSFGSGGKLFLDKGVEGGGSICFLAWTENIVYLSEWQPNAGIAENNIVMENKVICLKSPERK